MDEEGRVNDVQALLTGMSTSRISPKEPKISRRCASLTFLVRFSITICKVSQHIVLKSHTHPFGQNSPSHSVADSHSVPYSHFSSSCVVCSHSYSCCSFGDYLGSPPVDSYSYSCFDCEIATLIRCVLHCACPYDRKACDCDCVIGCSCVHLCFCFCSLSDRAKNGCVCVNVRACSILPSSHCTCVRQVKLKTQVKCEVKQQ